MGFRDVYNQLKRMKPMAQQQAKRLAQAAISPAIGGVVARAANSVANRTRKPMPKFNGQVAVPARKFQKYPTMQKLQTKPRQPR